MKLNSLYYRAETAKKRLNEMDFSNVDEDMDLESRRDDIISSIEEMQEEIKTLHLEEWEESVGDPSPDDEEDRDSPDLDS